MKKLTQTQAVILAMKENGGYSTLLNLYSLVLDNNVVSWKTKTPEASIRRIVQDERYFFKIRSGLWALNEFKDSLPKSVIGLLKKDDEETTSVDLHSYNQGLLVDYGNMLNFKTYIPAQDQGKIYLTKRLKEVASTTSLPSFTYSQIINRIRTIDVIWLDGYDKSLFPSKVFEVENSTDFIKSLNKFNELKHFTVEKYVVAPDHKQKLFQDTIQWDIYKSLKGQVQFLDYDNLEHSFQLMKQSKSRGSVLGV